MFNRILVATDGSELSQKAVSSAISLASLHKAELVVLTVVPRYATSYFEGAVSFSPDEVGAIEKRWADDAHDRLTAVATQAQAAGVKVQTVVHNANMVAEAIIRIAQKHQCDLIVMASHGRKGITRVLLGSETLDVLTHSALPVLVLR